MNIKDTVEKHVSVAFVCRTFEDVQMLLNELKKEDIRHTYYLYQEDWEKMFEKYTEHLSTNYQSVIMIVDEKTGYNIYSRSYKDWVSIMIGQTTTLLIILLLFVKVN
jgi:hypothetical protein